MIDFLLRQIFVSQWFVFTSLILLLVTAGEIGFRFGTALHRENNDAKKSQLGAIQGTVLGLLGLLIGFTFSMSAGRYEARRELVLSEANSIGTTYLRASLLPRAHRQSVEILLKQYVDARLAFYDAGLNTLKLTETLQLATRLQGEMWNHAVEAGQEAPNPITSTFIQSLNETIDLDAARRNALNSHVPGVVWLLLLAVAITGCYISGYATGGSGARSTFSLLILPLLLAIVMTFVADLDRPRGGLIDISQQPMIDLKLSLKVGD